MAEVIMASKEIITPRLILRPMKLEDAQALMQVRSTEAVYKWSSVGKWQDQGQAEDWITRHIAPSWARGHVVVERQTGEVIGTIGIPRENEIGYGLKQTHWGKGYATEALAIFMRTLFDKLSPEVEEWRAYSDLENEASGKVLSKVGFRDLGGDPIMFENPSLGTRYHRSWGLRREDLIMPSHLKSQGLNIEGSGGAR